MVKKVNIRKLKDWRQRLPLDDPEFRPGEIFDDDGIAMGVIDADDRFYLFADYLAEHIENGVEGTRELLTNMGELIEQKKKFYERGLGTDNEKSRYQPGDWRKHRERALKKRAERKSGK